MKKLLLFAGVATLALTFAFAYVVSPPPPPMLDANRQPIATTGALGYCVGVNLINGAPIADCLEVEHSRGTSFDLQVVINHFCLGAVDAGWGGSHQDCKNIMQEPLYWPLVHGGITNSWNARYPYPLDRFTENIQPDLSRTGQREGVDR